MSKPRATYVFWGDSPDRTAIPHRYWVHDKGSCRLIAALEGHTLVRDPEGVNHMSKCCVCHKPLYLERDDP